ncbi:hypothetical protein RVR_5551 [Actinacidiphila reveromycinica]|uniref:Thiol:disulfide interchange protein DsbD N-terminal domain-containing protein n=1 Tax=Actinacidiphila reveromycinica TaxID=659352 RepID=A0A7U3UUY2_9ACTN|nr:hypothetical protein [Streptomyces sp. SN-593]BBA99078.1 hypothetical protein RVR_5551 [Streptomyces sp. SN-593]
MRRAAAAARGSSVRSAAVAALLCAVVSGCGQGDHGGQGGHGDRQREAARTRASFTAGGVDVAVTFERSAADAVAVTATLSPRQKGFHLYSLALPDGGVDGLGIPTRLAVAAPLTATGPVTSSVKAHDVRPSGLDVALPVYPDGPVTLRLATRVAGGADRPGTASVRLTYGACSTDGACLAPVRAHPVTLELPPR